MFRMLMGKILAIKPEYTKMLLNFGTPYWQAPLTKVFPTLKKWMNMVCPVNNGSVLWTVYVQFWKKSLYAKNINYTAL